MGFRVVALGRPQLDAGILIGKHPPLALLITRPFWSSCIAQLRVVCHLTACLGCGIPGLSKK